MRLTPYLGRLAPVMLLLAGTVHAQQGVKLRPMAPILVDGTGAAIRQPEGVGCNGKRLVVADTGNSRLLPFTIADDVINAGAPITLEQLPYPTRVDVNSSGEIFVVDGRLRRVARLSASGEFVHYLDLGDESSSVTVVPRSVKVGREDTIYVLDVYSGRVVVLSPEGATLREIAFPDEYGFLSDIAVDDFGVVYAIDSVDKVVFHANKGEDRLTPLTGAMREEMDFPTSITSDTRGQLFIADQTGSGIVVLGRDGSYRGRQSGMGWKGGFLRYPSALCVDELGDLFVADRGNNRVQVFFIIQ